MDCVQTNRDAEFLCFSNFVGELVRDGMLEKGAASVMLVQAFWDNERRKAWDDGIDLDEIIRERKHIEKARAAARAEASV